MLINSINFGTRLQIKNQASFAIQTYSVPELEECGKFIH